MTRIAVSLLALCLAVAGCSKPGGATSTKTPRVSTTPATDEVTSLQAIVNQRDEEMEQMARGTFLLLTLSKEPEKYSKLIAFLTTIDSGELRCTIRDLTDYPLVLYMYHRSYVLPDGSHRPVFDRKSALVLLDANTRRAIDFVVGTGYRTEGHTAGEPWTTQWEHPDGTYVRYKILLSGFEEMSDEEK